MASYELTGKLIQKGDTVQRSETFRTREFVVEISEDANGRVFTNYVKFQCVQDRTSLLDSMAVGSTVRVQFNLRGSKWVKDGRENYITNLDAWRIENASLAQEPVGNTTNYSDMPPAHTPDAADDLPF